MAGYNGYSKSNNAVSAESEGRYPASVLAERLGVATGAIRALMETREYHHTGKMYNETMYYDEEEALEIIDRLRAWRPEAAETETREGCTVKYLEWGGTRRHPRATEVVLEGVRAERKGDWWTIYPAGGKPFRKNVKTRGFSISN